MKIQHREQIPQNVVEMEGAHGCQVRSLLSAADGTPTFAMREFEVAPGGHTPRHHHPYEHEVFVLEGEGIVYEGDQARPIRAGDVVFVQPDEVHQFRNSSQAVLKFLCLIPNHAADKQVTVVAECNVDQS